MAHDFVTLVSGLPRSGTSMMMRMLEAGGLPVLADHLRTADEDNPEGYYEFERVKKIEHDTAWLEEVLASQREMLVRRGKPSDASGDAKMAEFFTNHLRRVETWLAEQPNVDVLYVSYNELIQDPEPHCAQVAQFLGLPLDSGRMASVVSGALYRQRR